jgi:hypothetical protein
VDSVVAAAMGLSSSKKPLTKIFVTPPFYCIT